MKGKRIKVVLYFLFFIVSFPLNAQGTDQIKNIDSLPKHEQVRVLSDLCWKNREKNTKMALAYGLKGIKIAKAEGYEKDLAELYNFVGVIYQHYMFNVQEGMHYYDLGLPLSLELKDSVEIGYVYNNLGDAFYAIGNVPLAFEYGRKSLSIFQRLHNEQGIAYGYVNMGEANRINNQYKVALEYFEKAIELRKKIGDSIGVASATLEVARTLFLMGKTDSAQYYYERSLHKHEQIRNKNYMAYSMQGIGDVYLVNKEYDLAFKCYTMALELCKERHNPTGEIDSQLGIAKVLAYRGERKKGETVLDEAMEIAVGSKLIPNILKVYKAKGEFYHHLKEYKRSSENYQKYIHAYDSLFSVLQFQTLSQIKDRFKITEQLTTVSQDLKANKHTQIYGVLLIVLLILFSIILIYRNRTINRLSSELMATNKSKDKIFSIISHDLISPFNVLLGTSEMLVDDLNKNEVEDAKEKGLLIQRTSEESFRFISNLLDWARTQRKKINLHIEKFELAEVIEDVILTLRNQAAMKNIKVTADTVEYLIVMADKNLIQIVLINLLNNAIKFTPVGGKVVLTAKKENNQAKVSVKDNGVGISMPRIIDILNNSDIESTAGTKNEKGTGLGLIVCKEFIEMHGSEMHINSVEGEGTEFWFMLPLSS
ncbi:MAG: tetratricopeptide repeat-containing sensor histidine kinase [Bacteroidales bacterium]|nr:tetratricopeptide repeat-containing sensor histidine kinase [Bacteroidales bacterium]